MFWLLRRLLWFGTGASLGFGGAMWIRSRVLRVVERLAPEHVSAEVAENVRRAGGQVGSVARQASSSVREALDEGRSAARRREASLRGELVAGARPKPNRGARKPRRSSNEQGARARHQ